MSVSALKAPPLRFKTVIISDTHLGKKAASAAFLFEFLQHMSCDRLLMNGDVLEGWGMKDKKRKPFPEMHARSLDALNAKAAAGTEVVYIRGNHDEDLFKSKRNLSGRTITFRDKQRLHECPITFRKSFQHRDAQGRDFLVLHGDIFDGFMKSTKRKVIARYADHAYEGLVHLNGIFREVVHGAIGVHVSPAAFLKRRTKEVLGIIGDFEKAVSSKRLSERFDGVVCGHIHHAEMAHKGDMVYMNSGDWVEDCTALAEDYDGNWRIVDWSVEREKFVSGPAPTIFDKNPYEKYRAVTARQLGLVRRVWPGKDYPEMVDALRGLRHKLDHQNDRLSGLFARHSTYHAANDNVREKEREIRQKIGKLGEKIGEMQEKLAPVHRMDT